MVWMSLTAATVVLLVGVTHLLVGIVFAHRLAAGSLASESPPLRQNRGRAAVLVAVRGADPSLQRMVDALARQDYEDYEIHLVVDGQSLAEIATLVSTAGSPATSAPLSWHELRDPPTTCGLKCASLLQGLQFVSSECRYLAFIDCDIVPHRGWLSDLVRALDDPEVGLATGLQWFEPAGAASLWAGSWGRALWNAVAFVPSALAHNPWAGSMACRRDDFSEAKIADLWLRSIVDDGPMKPALARIGKRVVTVPGLILVNREACSLTYTANFIRRSLTWSRWYESSFGLAIAVGLFAAGMMSLLLSSLAILLIAQAWGWFALLVAAALASATLSAVAFEILRKSVLRNSKPARTEPRLDASPGINPLRLVGNAVLVGYLHCLFPLSVLQACLSRKIVWRGVTYRIDGPFQIRRLNHPPPISALESRSERQSVG